MRMGLSSPRTAGTPKQANAKTIIRAPRTRRIAHAPHQRHLDNDTRNAELGQSGKSDVSDIDALYEWRIVVRCIDRRVSETEKGGLIGHKSREKNSAAHSLVG